MFTPLAHNPRADRASTSSSGGGARSTAGAQRPTAPVAPAVPAARLAAAAGGETRHPPRYAVAASAAETRPVGIEVLRVYFFFVC